MGGPESESEGVAALKRVYAEMVMSTARESAGRVARSEALAVRMQRELSEVRAESLRMLLRMKRLADAKAAEAEVASSRRQSKASELESQLYEAEGIIVDLRAEISWTRDTVAKLKNNQLEALNSKSTEDDNLPLQDCTHQSDISALSDSQLPTPENSIAKNALPGHKIVNRNCCIANGQEAQLNLSRFTSHCSSDSDIAFETMRKKELEEGADGFEQKDLLLHGNQLAESLSLSEGVDLHSFKVQDSTVNDKHNDGGYYSKSDLKIQNLERSETLLGGSSKCLAASSLKQSEVWFGRDRSNCISPFNQLIGPYRRPSILSRSTKKYPEDNQFLDTLFSTETENYQESNEEPTSQSNFSKDKKETVREGKRQKVEDLVGMQSKVCHPCSHSLPNGCLPCTLSIHGNVESGEAQPKMSEDGDKLKPLRPGRTLIKGVPLSGNITQRFMALCRSSIPRVVNKEIESARGPVEQKDSTSCHPAVSHYQSNNGHDKVHATQGSGLSEVSDLRAEASGDRFMFLDEKATNGLPKYTFQWKHKKEPLTTLDQNSLPVMDTGDGTAEKYGGSFKSHRFSLVPDISKDNTHLAQVACQPISLSEERR